MADRDIQDIYPLAPTQEGMLFHTLYAPESGTYVEQASGTLRGELDGTAFEQAWQRLMDRHSVLRTAFVWQEVEEPVQVVFRRLPVPLARYDWRDLTPEQRSAQLEVLRNEDRAQGFDMGEAPL